MDSKKIIGMLLIILMVVFIAGNSFALPPLDLTGDNDGEDLNQTLDPNAGNGSSTNEETPSSNPTNENQNLDTDLPNTGIADTTALVAVGIFCVVAGIYAFAKFKSYSDI